MDISYFRPEIWLKNLEWIRGALFFSSCKEYLHYAFPVDEGSDTIRYQISLMLVMRDKYGLSREQNSFACVFC